MSVAAWADYRELVEKQKIAEKLIEWHVAHDVAHAAWKAKLVLAMIPMAVIYFATEALPIGLVGILMPMFAYFFKLLPMKMIGQTFAGDAPLFLLGVLAMGVTVIGVGLHKRLATWILGWTRGFVVPIVVLCVSMSVLGSFISAHAMKDMEKQSREAGCTAFMTKPFKKDDLFTAIADYGPN